MAGVDSGTMSEKDELRWICDLLAGGGVRFWIDSGTMLGLIREGGIMAGEYDIDLGMWADDEGRFEQVLPAIRAKGYRVLKRTYRGLTYRYLLIPLRKRALLVDFNLFRKHGKQAWCPLVFPSPNHFVKPNPLYYLTGALRFVINYFFERLPRVKIDAFPWTLICTVKTWWIPARFYEEVRALEGNIYASEDYDGYLQLRYGNWRVPRKDWIFYEHDGGIRHENPEAILQEGIER